MHLISPLAEVKGKDAVLNSINHFMSIFNNLVIRSACSNLDQVMIAYNLECPDPLGTIKAAVLLTFQNDLIIGYELFYDARPFVSKKEEIFGR